MLAPPTHCHQCTPHTEKAYHLGIEVGDEEAGGLVHSMGAPVLRVCEEEDLLPVLQVGNDLEGFGHLAGGETTHDLAHRTIHLHHLWIKPRGDDWRSILAAAHFCHHYISVSHYGVM